MSDPEKMEDGLYVVMKGPVTAAFVVEKGEVTRCAPILRRSFNYWKRFARRISALPCSGSGSPDPVEH